MDLRITILDENDDVLDQVFIYQDGSDSEGAAQIRALLKANFEVELSPDEVDALLPDIADFEPVYNGEGDYEDMCTTMEQLVGIPNEQIWTLLFCEGNILWSHGYHYVNRACGDKSYIYTRKVPPDDVFAAQAYIHEVPQK